jgi:hypothetical protein
MKQCQLYLEDCEYAQEDGYCITPDDVSKCGRKNAAQMKMLFIKSCKIWIDELEKRNDLIAVVSQEIVQMKDKIKVLEKRCAELQQERDIAYPPVGDGIIIKLENGKPMKINGTDGAGHFFGDAAEEKKE